jgi:hypothetical protein
MFNAALVRERTYKCGKSTIYIYSCPHHGIVRRLKNACNLKVCPRCRKRHGKKRFLKYGPFLGSMDNPIFLTLTLSGYFSLTETDKRYEHLRNAWRRMSQYLKAYANMKSYLKVIELKRYHDIYSFHIHIVYDGKLLTQDTVSRMWSQYTGNSMVVKIEPARYLRGLYHYLKKYVLKGNKLRTPEEEVAFHKKQFVHSYNCFVPDDPSPFFITDNSVYFMDFYECFCPACGHFLYGFYPNKEWLAYDVKTVP